MYKRPRNCQFTNKRCQIRQEFADNKNESLYFYGNSQKKTFDTHGLPRLEKQFDKRIEPYLYDEEVEKEYGSPYMEIANDSRYLYLHVHTFYGWGYKRNQTILFLYDSVKKDMTYCRDDSQKTFRMPHFCDIINIDEMFSCNPNIDFVSFMDTTSYYIFMKSGDKVRKLCIDAPLICFYGPFLWVIDAFEKEKISNPYIERIKKTLLMYICGALKRIPFLGKIDFFAQEESDLKFYFHYYKKKNIFSSWIENATWYRYYHSY